VASLEPPEFLNADTRRIWVATVEQLMGAGTHARVNPDALLAYVEAVAAHRRATELRNATDVLIERDGRPVPSPALEIQRQAATVIAQFSRQFGLNRVPQQQPMRPGEPIRPEGAWFCEQHKKWHGTCHNKDGSRCHGDLVEGLTTCRMHPGRNAEVKHLLAVQRRKNPLAGEPMDIGPAEALLWRVRVLAGEVQRLDDLIASLERDELVWGITSEESTDTDAGPYVKVTRQSRVNTWVLLRQQRESALHAACEAALRANIEERLVRLAEQQGAVIHRLLLAVLGDFGVDPADPRIPEILPRRLRELTA